jgi:Fanconi anemia group M protein
VLLAEDTRDEAFFWISRRREQEMEDELRELKGVAPELERELAETTLDAFEGESRDESGTAGGDGGSGDPTTDGEPTADTEPTASAVKSVDDAAADGAGGRPRDSSLAEFSASTADPEPAATADTETASAGGTAEADPSDIDADTDTDANADTDTDTDADADTSPEGVVAAADSGDDADVVEVVVDQRELDSTIARDLSTRDGVRTRLETLAVGDYVLSDRVVVERKTVSDFLDTLVGGDRSLFGQARDMSRHYARPVVVVEGEGLYEERNVHPGAIRGALAALAVDFGVSVLTTRDEGETTALLETIASREQTERNRQVSVHGEKAAKTLDEQQEYVVSAIADVGPVTAEALLAQFGSVEAVMTATEEELQETRGVGVKTAARIREVVGSDYAFAESGDDEGQDGDADES